MTCIYTDLEYLEWKTRRRILVDTGMLRHPSVLGLGTMHVSASTFKDVDRWSLSKDIVTRPSIPTVVGSPSTRAAFLEAQKSRTDELLRQCQLHLQRLGHLDR